MNYIYKYKNTTYFRKELSILKDSTKATLIETYKSICGMWKIPHVLTLHNTIKLAINSGEPTLDNDNTIISSALLY